MQVLSVGGSLTNLEIIINPGTIPAGFEAVIYATPAVNPGVQFVKNQFRFLGVAPAPVGTVITATALWNARFGSISIGQKMFVRIALVSSTSGQQGIPTEFVKFAS
jgi:hypothetical protein